MILKHSHTCTLFDHTCIDFVSFTHYNNKYMCYVGNKKKKWIFHGCMVKLSVHQTTFKTSNLIMHSFQSLKSNFTCMSNALLVPLNMLESHTSNYISLINKVTYFCLSWTWFRTIIFFKNSKRIQVKISQKH